LRVPQHSHGDVNLPAFLNAKNLKPFISNELLVTSSQIEFRRLRAGKAFGYSADLLPKVCEVFIDAERKQALVPAQSGSGAGAWPVAMSPIILASTAGSAFLRMLDRLGMKRVYHGPEKSRRSN
jgi:hypothetical protein